MSENPSEKIEHNGDNTIAFLTASLSSISTVKVTVELHEGNDRPNISFSLFDSNSDLLSRSFIINCIDQHMDFTLHIRHPQPVFPLTLRCETFFEDDQAIDQKELILTS